MQTTSDKKKFCAKVMVKVDDSSEPQPITFQLDTGASCSTISLEDYNKITKEKPQPSHAKLKLYDQSTIKPLGQVKLRCTSNVIMKKVHFQVVKDVPISLLSGLGKLPGVYHIETDPDVKPVESNPRRVPISVQEELKAKIDELEQTGVLAKVTEPTPWINNMVAVKQPNKLRICLDPQELNKAIIRNHYPTPIIDDVAPKLTNAKVFTVVDHAKDGFLQVELDEPSSYFKTTFWTPYGHYRWLRMPFGIKSAPEEFQILLDECIEGLPNLHAVHDDIIVFSTDDNEHDEALKLLLERFKEQGLKLNK
ncbi:hypothetical protein QZH41_000317 [Actinostola sp. cb2023]|nr:hypothetical protein QZH41_000317 [Actinostola sp. cb2023]